MESPTVGGLRESVSFHKRFCSWWDKGMVGSSPPIIPRRMAVGGSVLRPKFTQLPKAAWGGHWARVLRLSGALRILSGSSESGWAQIQATSLCLRVSTGGPRAKSNGRTPGCKGSLPKAPPPKLGVSASRAKGRGVLVVVWSFCASARVGLGIRCRIAPPPRGAADKGTSPLRQVTQFSSRCCVCVL